MIRSLLGGSILGRRGLCLLRLAGLCLALLHPGTALARTAVDFVWSRSPVAVLPEFLGVPYRQDGALNHLGRYVTFNTPDKVLPSPGLNCSGLVLAAVRAVTGRTVTIEEAKRDREGDSGPGAPMGQDWDFGYDLIMNLGQVSGEPRLLRPESSPDPEALNGLTAPAWDPHDDVFVREFVDRTRPGDLYLVSFSRHSAPDAPPKLHYHVGIAVRDAAGAVWLYSTTRNSGKVIRHNLADPKGLKQFRHSFRNTPGSVKRLTIVGMSPLPANRPIR